jgi:hypothetical protein
MYQENGGGTLTRSDIIEIELGTRVVDIDGVATGVRVMRVLSIERAWGDAVDERVRKRRMR